MAERRSLVEGLKTPEPPLDPVKAQEFIYGKSSRPPQPAAAPASTSTVPGTAFSTRFRTDYVRALKRASLDRQLKGQEPNSIRDILEQALEPWLKSNGYIP